MRNLVSMQVTTEAELKAAIAAADLPRPTLGLNCVGGSASTAVAKSLGYCLCTFGGHTLLTEHENVLNPSHVWGVHLIKTM